MILNCIYPELQIFGVLNLDGLQMTQEMTNIVRRTQLTIGKNIS
jgi:hypothetical protein